MNMKPLKDEALERYYQGLFAMYATPGWKMLMEDVGRMIEVHNTVNGIDSEQQLWFRKGELAQMQWLLNHQPTVEQAYAALVAEQEDTAEVAPTGGKAQVVS